MLVGVTPTGAGVGRSALQGFRGAVAPAIVPGPRGRHYLVGARRLTITFRKKRLHLAVRLSGP
jgi:hypothetical protein